MEAKIKSGTFLAESCGQASNPPTAPTTQKYHFFYVPPNYNSEDFFIDLNYH